MPAFTPNRAYPYSLPGDPADVPGALQALAEAIDDDVCALQAGVTGRPVARFRGTTPFSSFTTSLGLTVGTSRLPFDTVDFDMIPCTVLSQEVGTRMIRPDAPGFYFVTTSVAVPTLTLTTTVNVMRSELRKGDSSNVGLTGTLLGSTSHSVAVNTSDQNVRLFTLSAGTFMNGTTDSFALTFFADTTPDVSEYVIGERTITMLRMTTS